MYYWVLRNRIDPVFHAVYRCVAQAAYVIDKGHISAFSKIFKRSGWMSYRQYRAGNVAQHKLAVNHCLIMMGINLIERPEQLPNWEDNWRVNVIKHWVILGWKWV